MAAALANTVPSGRLDPLEVDIAPDDDLPHYDSPDYEPMTAPQYDEAEAQLPLHCYHLRQIDRKQQIFVPFGPSANASYKMANQGTFRLFSKKPEIQLIRTATEGGVEDPVASINLDKDGPLPWRPRANFSHFGSNSTTVHTMESRNFSDWTIDIAGTPYIWVLGGRPISLSLRTQNSDFVIARFTYSSQGTLATGGAEVGELSIYRDQLSVDRDGIEKIMCGVLVAVLHFKKMGRHYWNDPGSDSAAHAQMRGQSLAGAWLPMPAQTPQMLGRHSSV
ncbi:hypothetical protein BDV96DRAFT_581241 [Lophiotrema nucula]|uniref:Uncharacterized protein n=1 Tax=Lophiotrema nucula TaxID=690887 RepID=A0A6A5YZX4_9PLEO|nr:hypothetical protein BDV96DRAFT_581241 [Lophiotrema nucula]